jgi:hypothetical protein
VTFAISDLAIAMRGLVLRETALDAARDGVISKADAEHGLAALEDQARRGTFLGSVTAFMMLAQKPG